jgi:hypothetical protein
MRKYIVTVIVGTTYTYQIFEVDADSPEDARRYYERSESKEDDFKLLQQYEGNPPSDDDEIIRIEEVKGIPRKRVRHD